MLLGLTTRSSPWDLWSTQTTPMIYQSIQWDEESAHVSILRQNRTYIPYLTCYDSQMTTKTMNQFYQRRGTKLSTTRQNFATLHTLLCAFLKTVDRRCRVIRVVFEWRYCLARVPLPHRFIWMKMSEIPTRLDQTLLPCKWLVVTD